MRLTCPARPKLPLARSGHLALATALLLGAPALAAVEAPLQLPPGPHAVGFRSLDLLDQTRTYHGTHTETGEPERRDRARPIQTSVWYPSVRTGRPAMRVLELLELGARQDGAATSAEAKAFVAEAVAHYAPKPGEARARLERALATRTGAVRDAPAAPGRFPVVVYNAGGGQPSWDNFALCQHLASHGFVVVASPSTWSWSRVGGGSDLASAEAAARDLEFHVGWARSQPSVDPGRIALMGFSWGGQAAVMVALRNPAVRAVVSLDGSEGNPETQWEQAPHRDPRQARAAYLGFSSSLERSVQGAVLRGAPPPSQEDLARSGELLAHPRFASGLKYADSYFVVMERFNHGNFASHWAYLEVEDDRRPGEPTAEQEHQDSAALARYVVEFLRGYLRDDGGARRWLARPPAENGIPPGTLRVDFRPASRWPRPAVDEFASLARTRGLDGLQSLVAQARAEDPAYGLTEEDFMTWAHLLGHAHQPVQALGVLRWAAEAWPESAGVRQHLCPALEADRPAQLACWRRLAELSPEDADVKKSIAELEAK